MRIAKMLLLLVTNVSFFSVPSSGQITLETFISPTSRNFKYFYLEETLLF